MTQSRSSQPLSPDAAMERTVVSKVTKRLIWFMGLMYFCAILDRANVSIAVLGFKNDLHFSDNAFAWGAGIFFIGYFIFEVPSNVIMERVGPRLWMARIMLTWGILASAMMFIHSATSYCIMRFLLGVAEAGFFPGMMLYLTYWFPTAGRARAASRFVLWSVMASIVGNPLGALFLGMNGHMGLHGWQWLFLLEGIPSIILGFVVLGYLTDKPEQANWLQPTEREWLVRRMEAERAHRQKYHHMSLLDAFSYPRVLHLCLIFILRATSDAGLGTFANLFVKERSGWHDTVVNAFGFIIPITVDTRVLLATMAAPICGAVALMISAAHSDKSGERRGHLVVGFCVAAVGVGMFGLVSSTALTITALCIVRVGMSIADSPYWALTTSFLTGMAAAGGIAFINSVGNLGSFFGPLITSYLEGPHHEYVLPLSVLTVLMLGAALSARLLPHDPAHQYKPEIEAAE